MKLSRELKEQVKNGKTPNRIIIISGPCGAGKSTVSKLLAKNSTYNKTVHLHTDDFYNYICNGHIAPWLPEAVKQNTVVMEAFAASAAKYASGGYEVIVDGVIGSWFLEPWLEHVDKGFDVRYFILRADKETTLLRALNRKQSLIDIDGVKRMLKTFSNMGAYEPYVIDTTHQSVEKTVSAIQELLAGGLHGLHK